jgi:hypothetical protein
VTLPHAGVRPVLVEQLLSVLADGLQGVVPGRLTGLDNEQVVLGQSRQSVGDRRAGRTGQAHDPRGLDAEPGREDRQPGQQCAIRCWQEVHAPRDRVAQRSVPACGARTRRQQAQAMIGAGEEPVEPE